MFRLKCAQPYFMEIPVLILNSENQIGTYIAFLNSPLNLNWDFLMLVLRSTLNFFLIHKKIENWDFWMLLCWTSEFLPIHERDKKLGFLFISLGRLHFQIFHNSQKSWKIEIFELPLVSSFVGLWVFQACVGEGQPIYNEIASFQVKKCSYLCNNFVSV